MKLLCDLVGLRVWAWLLVLVNAHLYCDHMSLQVFKPPPIDNTKKITVRTRSCSTFSGSYLGRKSTNKRDLIMTYIITWPKDGKA